MGHIINNVHVLEYGTPLEVPYSDNGKWVPEYVIWTKDSNNKVVIYWYFVDASTTNVDGTCVCVMFRPSDKVNNITVKRRHSMSYNYHNTKSYTADRNLPKKYEKAYKICKNAYNIIRQQTS